MIYIFHDYEWNEYVLNDSIHWAADSRDFLIDETVPDAIKNEHWASSASLANLGDDEHNSESSNVKDNQISFEEVIISLWSEEFLNNESTIESWSDDLPRYEIYQVDESDNSTLIIEKLNRDETAENETARTFSFIYEGRIIPSLVERNEIFGKNNGYISWSTMNIWFSNNENLKSSWVTIIEWYKNCMTPRGYRIEHWDSVLAYNQMNNAPDICNIERRFCRDGKLSWTYTQQWCSVNESYTFSQWGEAEVTQKEEENKPNTTQNDDWSVTVNNPEIGSEFVFDKPNNTHTEFYSWDNVKVYEEVEQTTRPHRWCTTPWWEKVGHWHLVQAFKHGNWFSDAPCEAQLRICTMWKLVWTFTQPSCKTRDTSFIDWINWSPTRETYSKEKLELIKQWIKDEQNYEKNYRRATNSDVLDNILKILDS